VIARLFEVLLAAYGAQGWWPLISRADCRGFDGQGYHPNAHPWPRTTAQRFEIAMGAVLTQNTSWTNAEKALAELFAAGVRTPGDVLSCSVVRLAGLVRSSGYHNQKSSTLKALAGFFSAARGLHAGNPPRREELLALRGVGSETADSIMLYAFGSPVFVVDAYTRRLLSRVGIGGGGEGYGEIQALFHRALPADPVLFGEYHALIVAHAKARCRARPLCEGCPVTRCATLRSSTA
jgi:endonuclease-3 related protein